MKLYLGLLENSPPLQPRIFGEFDDKLVDLSLAYAGYLTRVEGNVTGAYDLAGFLFPQTIDGFLRRARAPRQAAQKLRAFVRDRRLSGVSGPAGEKAVYERDSVRIVVPLAHGGKTIVIGFADQARHESLPGDLLPTGFLKLPSTFVSSGEPLVQPKFSEQIDCDACVGIVIGKSARRVGPEEAWEHVAGLTLLVDVTARDIHQREERTKNNLLGKNFPSSAALGPALLLETRASECRSLEVVLTVNGAVRQKFSLNDCAFTVEQIIAYWSRVGLEPGDVLAIGASMAFRAGRLQDRAAVAPGDTVCCSAAAIGELSHRVISAKDRS